MLLFCAALLLRVAVVVWLSPAAGRPSTYEHGAIAENLLAGRGFSVRFLGSEGPTSQQAPWVPFVLAGCYAVFGVGTSAALAAFQGLQCLAGSALVVCVVRSAWNWFPERRGIGWGAGWLAALYPPHVYMTTHVQAATWGAWGAAWLFAVVSERLAQPSLRRATLAGVVMGWLLWIDPILALVGACGLIELFRSSGSTTPEAESPRSAFQPLPALRCVGVAIVSAAAVAAPWIVRNYRVHGELVLIKSTFGYALWQGNNPAGRGTDKIPKPEAAALAAAHDGSLAGRNRALWEARHETLYIDDVLLKPTGYREFAGLSEPERSRLLGTRAWEFIRTRPADYARLCLQRLRYFLLWDETNPKAADPIYRTASITWLAGSLLGLAALGRGRRRLATTVLAFLLTALFHALTITSARFRIPVESFGFLWAAAGFAPAWTNIGRRLGFSGRTRADAGPTTTAAERAPPAGHHWQRKVAARSRTQPPR